MLRNKIAGLLVAGSILVSACGSGSPTGETPSATPLENPGSVPSVPVEPLQSSESPTLDSGSPTAAGDEVPAWLLAESHPLDLDVYLDPDVTTRQEVGPKGGELSLELLDGTVFRLLVPEGALFTPEEISMTAASNVTGLEIQEASMLAGDLQPEGLIFLRPATLRIELSEPAKAAKITAFNADGQGTNFHLIPSETDGDQIMTELTHFTTSGAVFASQTALFELQAAYTPTGAESRAKQQLATIRHTVDVAEVRVDAWTKILLEWVGYSIVPNMIQAVDDEEAIPTAIGEFLSWDQEVRFIARTNDFESDADFMARFKSAYETLYDAMAEALKNAIERAHAGCVQDKDPIEALNMVSWALLAANFHAAIFGLHGLDGDYITERIRQCVRFNISFSSLVRGGGPTGGNWTTEVSASIPMEGDKFNFDEFDSTEGLVEFLTSTAPLIVDDFQVDSLGLPAGADCLYTSTDGEISAVMTIPFNLFRDLRTYDKVILTLRFPSFPQEIMHCTIQGNSVDQEVKFWMGSYAISVQSGVQAGAGQILPRPLKTQKGEGGFEIQLAITNEGGLFAEGREAGPLDSAPDLYFEALYQVIHTPG